MSKRNLEETTEDICSFYLERKKRPCRMKTLEGMEFCPHHSHLGPNQNSKKGARIPCPYDSSHFCYESRLQKHLKKCNTREKEKPEYYIQSINAGTCSKTEPLKLGLADISDEKLLDIIHKIKNLYQAQNLSVRETLEMHPLLKLEMEEMDDGFNSFKHMKQQAALLHVMEERGLLKEGTCFVEFGAGKGQLMYWIIRCVPENTKPAFVLVDKSAQRHKSDNKFKDSDVQIQRIRIDIQHLHLGKMRSIGDKLHQVVGVSKHLCGAATDLALTCLTTTLKGEDERKQSPQAHGILMALCCHHRCSWNMYVGKEFLKNQGITAEDFQIMCCIASWATCGLRNSSESQKSETNICNENEDIENIQENRVNQNY